MKQKIWCVVVTSTSEARTIESKAIIDIFKREADAHARMDEIAEEYGNRTDEDGNLSLDVCRTSWSEINCKSKKHPEISCRWTTIEREIEY